MVKQLFDWFLVVLAITLVIIALFLVLVLLYMIFLKNDKEEDFTISHSANVACTMFQEFDVTVRNRGGLAPKEDVLILKKILTQTVGAREKELSLVGLQVMGVYDYYPNVPIPWDHLIYNMALVCPRWGFNVEFFNKKVTMN